MVGWGGAVIYTMNVFVRNCTYGDVKEPGLLRVINRTSQIF